MGFPPNFTDVWDITQPPDTQAANLLGQDLRNLRNDIMQRMSLLSGTLANRPTPEIVNATWGGAGFGLLYFSTDSNQIFQWNGAAWVDVTASFTSSVAAKVDLVGQTVGILSTTIYTPNSAGFYRMTAAVFVTNPTFGSDLVVSSVWTQKASVAEIDLINVSNLSIGTILESGEANLYSDAAKAIQYQVGWTSGGVGDSYDLHIRLERL